MSLPVLVVLVVVGIALSVAAVHFTGGSRVATLDDEKAALLRFAIDFPEEKVAGVRLTEDHGTAFLALAGNRRSGIVHAVGGCFLTRIVTAADVASIRIDGPKTVAIQFKDFTWKGGRFAFATSADAALLFAALDPAVALPARKAA